MPHDYFFVCSWFGRGLLEFVSLDVCLDRVRAGSAATDHETQATQNTARHKLLLHSRRTNQIGQ